MQRVRVQPVLREPKGKQTWLIIRGGLFQRRGLLAGSRRLVLSGRQRRAGEDDGAARRLEAECVRGWGGGRRGSSARATQVSIVKLPEELLVLHRQTLVHLWLLLERFLQRCLLCRQLSVAQRHNKEHTVTQIYRCSKDHVHSPQHRQKLPQTTALEFGTFRLNKIQMRWALFCSFSLCDTWLRVWVSKNHLRWLHIIFEKEQVRECYWKITSEAVLSWHAWMRQKQLDSSLDGSFKLWLPSQ